MSWERTPNRRNKVRTYVCLGLNLVHPSQRDSSALVIPETGEGLRNFEKDSLKLRHPAVQESEQGRGSVCSSF